MRRIIIALTLALSLGGCAGVPDPFKLLTLATASVQNPVTPTMLYQAEQGMVAVVEGLLIYKDSCARKVIPQSCREVIAQIQVYTRQAKPLLVSLRKFVRENDQVNAVAVYNAVQDLLAKIKAARAASGVT